MGKKKKKPIKWRGVLMNAMTDLIVGIILILIDKYVG